MIDGKRYVHKKIDKGMIHSCEQVVRMYADSAYGLVQCKFSSA